MTALDRQIARVRKAYERARRAQAAYTEAAQEVRRAVAMGATYRQISEATGLTKQRISYLIHNPEKGGNQ